MCAASGALVPLCLVSSAIVITYSCRPHMWCDNGLQDQLQAALDATLQAAGVQVNMQMT